ncbi:hypothetical protein JXI42_10850 [bacterium]|jgi:hypothetical protein|nr:hypothetical protein [bacterium]
MKNIFKYCLILIICIIFACHGYACSHDEYKQITIKNQLGSYSLEYPSHYDKDFREVLDFDIPYTHLLLDGPAIRETAEVFDPDTGNIRTVVGERGSSSIEVIISNYKVYHGESYTAADRIDAVLKGQAKWDNFQLLERSPITVSGVEGELIIYLVDKLMPIPVEDGKNLEYVRAAYFDYNDLTWKIVAKCNQDIQEEVTAYFNHIIETFKILE